MRNRHNTGLAFILGSIVSAVILVAEEPVKPLHQIQNIYVRPLASELDEALIQKLLRWKGIKVVFTPEDADAVLIGSTDSGVFGVPTAIGPIVWTEVEAEVTLVDSQTGDVVWSTKKSGGGLINVAEKIVKQLNKDWEKSKKEAEKQKKQ